MTKEQEQFVIDNFNTMSVESLRKVFNQKYGTDYKTTGFHYHTNRLGLKKHIEHQYSALEDKFLEDNSSLMTREELTEAFNKKFGTSIKCDAIGMRCWKKGFEAQDDGKFKQGSLPWIKTKGGREEYCKKLKGGNSASFKKGIIPHNTRPVGSCRKDINGEEYIKTEKGWKTRLTVEYEKAYGEVPKGYRVFAVDGDKTNLSPNNLRAIDNYTTTVLMSNRWLDKGAEIFDTGHKYADLKRTLSERV